ncbi:MAG TPA: hypothetical protein VFW71_01475 [Actinomycetota bacterium]|nr:hypothetical protein [Actinomycetota bacterium]
MWLFPLGAALVSTAFAAQLAKQYLAKRRPHQLAWTAALSMFALATLATAEGVRGGWTPGLFRLYYLFGALINVPFLAVGTVYLLAPRRWAHVFAALVVGAATVGAWTLVRAPLDAIALAAVRGIPESSVVIIGRAPLSRALSRYYSYTAFAIVVLGALWSSGRLLRQRSEHLRRLATGNLMIAGGTLVVAAASIAIRLGRGSDVAALFSTGLLAGITLMFLGFLRTRSRPAAAPATVPAADGPAPATP